MGVVMFEPGELLIYISNISPRCTGKICTVNEVVDGSRYGMRVSVNMEPPVSTGTGSMIIGLVAPIDHFIKYHKNEEDKTWEV